VGWLLCGLVGGEVDVSNKDKTCNQETRGVFHMSSVKLLIYIYVFDKVHTFISSTAINFLPVRAKRLCRLDCGRYHCGRYITVFHDNDKGVTWHVKKTHINALTWQITFYEFILPPCGYLWHPEDFLDTTKRMFTYSVLHRNTCVHDACQMCWMHLPSHKNLISFPLRPHLQKSPGSLAPGLCWCIATFVCTIAGNSTAVMATTHGYRLHSRPVSWSRRWTV